MNKTDPTTSTSAESTRETTASSRRNFLRLSATSGGVASALVGGLVTPATSAKAETFSPSDPEPSLGGDTRAQAVRAMRQSAAQSAYVHAAGLGDQLCNGDEDRYDTARFLGSFSKTLPCNGFGEVDPRAFERLRTAMRSGDEADFRRISLASEAERGLANPQAAFKMEMSGMDSHATRIDPAHALRSPELAGEMVEVYWQALLRDVPFTSWSTHRIVDEACTELTGMTATPGPLDRGQVTDETLFRGSTPGDLTGPYISQFLWLPFNFGQAEITQRYRKPFSEQHFMANVDDWLHIQRGAEPSRTTRMGSQRYISTLRSLAEYVHQDLSFQAYLNAALVIIGFGPEAFAAENPYPGLHNRDGFVTFGEPYAVEMVTRAAQLAFTGAWFQKWRVHRYLRPEALGGRVHFMREGRRTYELHDELLHARALDRARSKWKSYLLAQAFPEGSPTHPSFPAGHACVAGACVTVLKAIFDEDFVIPEPFVASSSGASLLGYSGPELRVGGELNKLASNIAFGRNAGGVHYRQDGVQGMLLGEQQALSLLADQTRSLSEMTFEGFRLTKFDGTQVHIQDGVVRTVR